MSSTNFALGSSPITSLQSSLGKPKFHPTLTVSNLKNNIPFKLEMEKDHYAMWTELFETHAQAIRVFHHIIPQPGKEYLAPTDVDHE